MFEIILLNAEFGQVLNAEGDIHIRGTEEFRPNFRTIEDALAEKDLLLESYIYACVVIKDLESGEVSQEYYNEDLGPKFSQEKNEFYKWAYLPLYKRLFTKKPVFKYYDGKH